MNITIDSVMVEQLADKIFSLSTDEKEDWFSIMKVINDEMQEILERGIEINMGEIIDQYLNGKEE